jgi:hypothetical protein
VGVPAGGQDRELRDGSIGIGHHREQAFLDDRLLYELRGKVPALHAIGDCTGPQRIREAIESGYRVACSL